MDKINILCSLDVIFKIYKTLVSTVDNVEKVLSIFGNTIHLSMLKMKLLRDIAVTGRIFHACQEEKIPFDQSALNGLLYSTKTKQDVKQIIEQAKKLSGNIS